MAASKVLKKLVEPGRIGQMHVRNRIVMPAMLTNYGTPDGYVTQQTKDYYEERAKGGVGLIIVEATTVDFRHRIGNRQLAVDDDKFIPGLRELAQVIQRHGAKVALQLQHAGSASRVDVTHVQAVAPSAVARPGVELPRELTTSEIADIVGRFAKGAQRGKEAGFDGIEIHAAHGYIFAQFLSSAWNRRKDKYGGALDNRARFLLEVLRAIRETVGESYPVWCRINGEETRVPGGITLGEAQQLAKMLEEAGADALNVSSSDLTFGSPRSSFYPPGWAMHLAAGIKKVVNIPVMAVGRISPELGEQLLRDKKADFIVMGRAHRADPELANKITSGSLDDIRPCLACGRCSQPYRPNGDPTCSVNAAMGREREYEITPAKRRRQVLVVGGGPAGMEAARVAALRGHKVVLCEKSNRLGGQLLLAAVPPYKGEIKKLVNFLATQIEKLNVRVDLNTEVTPSQVECYKPDVVILATGAIPLVPKIAGIDRRNVVKAEDVLASKVEIGERIAVLGGGNVGCEVADFLVEKGKKVTIVEMLEGLASDMKDSQGRQILLDMLTAKGVTMLTEMKGEEISDVGLVIADKHGQRQTIEVDTIVLACGSIPNANLLEELRGIIPEMHIAGDCVKPRTILEAINDGAHIARVV